MSLLGSSKEFLEGLWSYQIMLTGKQVASNLSNRGRRSGEKDAVVCLCSYMGTCGDLALK